MPAICVVGCVGHCREAVDLNLADFMFSGCDTDFFDKQASKLYYFQNASVAKAPTRTGFVSAEVKVLINISGTQDDPVKDIHISGITFRDAAYTFMDPHGMPRYEHLCTAARTIC